jgi:hypothetical protein
VESVVSDSTYFTQELLASPLAERSEKGTTSMADEYRESERKGVSNFNSPHSEEIKQLVVTINPAMGGIVKVEKFDKAGKHEELSDEECASLVGEDEVDEIQDAIEEGFEAAVMSVIGEDRTEREDDDEEEKAIRRFLINDLLIPPSVSRRVLHRILLSRMLRRRLPNGQQQQEIRNLREESTAPRAIPFRRSSRAGKRK